MADIAEPPTSSQRVAGLTIDADCGEEDSEVLQSVSVGDLWNRLYEAIRHWPWATIAAFLALAVTLWLANIQTRQRRRQIRQDTVIEINFQSSAWINAASEFLAHVRVYVESAGTTPVPWRVTVLEPLTTATNAIDRALKSAHMTVNDFSMMRCVTNAELQLAQFLTLTNGPHPTDSTGLLDETANVLSKGKQLNDAFAATTEELINRGFEVYRLRRGIRFRVRRRTAIWWAWSKTHAESWFAIRRKLTSGEADTTSGTPPNPEN